MESRIIEKIHNNTKSIILMSDYNGFYVVIFKDGTSYKDEEFGELSDALKYFNKLAEIFDNE